MDISSLKHMQLDLLETKDLFVSFLYIPFVTIFFEELSLTKKISIATLLLHTTLVTKLLNIIGRRG